MALVQPFGVLPPHCARHCVSRTALGPKLLKKAGVLVVDDLAVNRLILGTILTKLGFEVLEAENGLQACDVFASQRELICVFMDLQMPIADGFSATKGIRELESQAPVGEALRVPVVVCTASCLDDLVDGGQTVSQRALELGADGAVRKPLTTLAVQAILDTFAPRWRSSMTVAAAPSPVAPAQPCQAAPCSPVPAYSPAASSASPSSEPLPKAHPISWRRHHTFSVGHHSHSRPAVPARPAPVPAAEHGTPEQPPLPQGYAQAYSSCGGVHLRTGRSRADLVPVAASPYGAWGWIDDDSDSSCSGCPATELGLSGYQRPAKTVKRRMSCDVSAWASAAAAAVATPIRTELLDPQPMSVLIAAAAALC
ncbi:hypothetical protein HYH03_000132 [Edaphochlamys debaryana]|uniref:Response regulatory domain-containing protein n=1 Tax=Edaphochlamys debaryana TaxID=47281 RepID=A0A836C7C4_9CHLO|nr:hypothetical protein HYH03_000132 [Edaphochlamys debaryana]|eukprot:KAG2501627.1 hypothetical protein HYH03_000132 [Edaphochlamys debaryana]